VGVTWRLLSTDGPRPLGLGVRTDAFLSDLLVSRGGETHARWLPTASLLIEATWFVLGRDLGLVAGAGVDASLGTTHIAVGSDTVAAISPFRAIGAAGVVLCF
jgi:hypothetical protein